MAQTAASSLWHSSKHCILYGLIHSERAAVFFTLFQLLLLSFSDVRWPLYEFFVKRFPSSTFADCIVLSMSVSLSLVVISLITQERIFLLPYLMFLYPGIIIFLAKILYRADELIFFSKPSLTFDVLCLYVFHVLGQVFFCYLLHVTYSRYFLYLRDVSAQNRESPLPRYRLEQTPPPAYTDA